MLALLLTTFAGLSAADPLIPRGNNNNAQYCASASKKCAQAYQLNAASTYCSSALKSTVTKTSTICKETTTYSKKYTSTCTVKGGATVTETVRECLRPTQAVVDVPIEARDIEEKRGAAQKPNCLPYEKASVTEACKCLNVKGGTTTVVSKTTTTKTYTVTVKAATTITEPTDPNATPTTTWVYRPTPPAQFYIANEDGPLLGAPSGQDKRTESGMGIDPDERPNALQWDSSDLLWQLNNANKLVITDSFGPDVNDQYIGQLTAELTRTTTFSQEGDEQQVSAASQAEINTGDWRPLTCSVSVSRNNDGLCPLTCRVRRGDVNQGPTGGNWFLGQPGSLSPEAGGAEFLRQYKTYVVTDPDRRQGGGRGGRGGRNFGRRGEKYASRRG